MVGPPQEVIIADSSHCMETGDPGKPFSPPDIAMLPTVGRNLKKEWPPPCWEHESMTLFMDTDKKFGLNK